MRNNKFSLKGNISVITGGLGRLGAAITEAMAKSGSKVIILDTNEKKWKAISSTLAKRRLNVYYENCDIIQLEKIRQHIRGIEKKYGDIDIWINSAYPRTEDWAAKLEDVRLDSWRKNIEMQLNSYCICSNEIAKRMAGRKRGCIINIASIYGVVAPDFSIYEGTNLTSPAAYSAIKGGVIAYSRYLASYFGNKGVRINVVCPGGILNRQPERFVKQYSKRTILGRLAKAYEIAWPVVFLASDAASYITGSVLVIDGGLTST